jgi:Fur family peroxide stress response transcriptional regulator
MSIDKTERKHSKKRDAILRVLQSTTAHPGAQWVYDQLKSSIPDLSLATVYRNIALFQKEGAVLSVGVIDGEERFDAHVTPHPHFICACCGSIIDFPCQDMELLKAVTDNREGFRIDHRKTVFTGLCAGCTELPAQFPMAK